MLWIVASNNLLAFNKCREKTWEFEIKFEQSIVWKRVNQEVCFFSVSSSYCCSYWMNVSASQISTQSCVESETRSKLPLQTERKEPTKELIRWSTMSQKDSLSKLKTFFRLDKNASGKCLCNWIGCKHWMLYGFLTTGSSREKTDADLLRELEVLLQPQVATAQRCKTLKELCESDKINRLSDVSWFFISQMKRFIDRTNFNWYFFWWWSNWFFLWIFRLNVGNDNQIVWTDKGFNYRSKTHRSSSYNLSILPEIGAVPVWRFFHDSSTLFSCDRSEW